MSKSKIQRKLRRRSSSTVQEVLKIGGDRYQDNAAAEVKTDNKKGENEVTQENKHEKKMKSKTKTVRKTKKTLEVVKPEEPKFEDIFNDPLMQKTALEIFQFVASPLPVIEESIRSSRPIRSTRSEEARTPTPPFKLDLASPLANNRQILTASLSPHSPELANPGDKGFILVQKILNRCESERSKKKEAAKLKKESESKLKLSKEPAPKLKRSVKKEIPAMFDSSDDDFINLDDDSDAEPDFMEHCVSNYKLKKKLCDAHIRVIENMPLKKIGRLCEQIFPDLVSIRQGEIPSKRHDIYQICGLSKQRLRDIVVAKPFSDSQERIILKIIEKGFSQLYSLMDNNGELIHYIANVSVPEALIRIYAKANNIDYDLAEKELRYKGAYEGDLPPELVEYASSLK